MRGNAGARLGRGLDLLALGALSVYLAAAVPWALVRAAGDVDLAIETGESLAAGRARVYGERYSQAIDQIRRDLPVSEPYLLVEGGSPASGGVFWVRYDLAPRRAVYLGRLDELTDAARVRRR